MRVLQVNKFFYEKGGTERYFFSVSRALERRGHTVVHFSMRHPDNLASPYSDYFVSSREYSNRGGKFNDISDGLSFIRSREAARNIARLVGKTRPDVAHLHNIYHQITPSILPVLRGAGIPVVMTLHDHKLICPNYSLFDGRTYCYRCRGGRFHRAAATRCNEGSFARSLLLSIEAYWQKFTRVYDGVGVFVAPSRYMRGMFLAEGYSPDRVVYIPPFVGADESTPKVGPAGPTRQGKGAECAVEPPPDRFILYFGRLGAEKGLFSLLDAVSGLGDVPLVVCGDGPLRRSLEARAAKTVPGRIRFMGHLGMSGVDAVVRRASAVVLPSIAAENAPYTVLEAMAAGVPVIVSNVGGLPELAEAGGGLVFTAGSAGELAERIREVWENPTLASEMGAKGRRFVSEELREDRHIARLENVYRKAVGPR
jgi:glycosyltransferase involved in cell wall biosynthesis